ncbi:MAG: hypothetical protein E6R08_08720 [Nevskiaceae bacterium]|nr:MAG: hypothetical protein E6R08_08720 [Nevskiaceae bacterium]
MNGSAPQAAAWRSVLIAPPRRMARHVGYRMIARRDGVEETIARDVTIAQALVIALEHGGGYGAAMVYKDADHREPGGLRQYVVGRLRLTDRVFEPVLHGVVPRSNRLETDLVRALEFFEEILADDPRAFFDGRIERERLRSARRADIAGDRL